MPSGKLNTHLNEIDEATHARMELITKQISQAQGITEDLKARNQMARVGARENAWNTAEEIVLLQLIYH